MKNIERSQKSLIRVNEVLIKLYSTVGNVDEEYLNFIQHIANNTINYYCKYENKKINNSVLEEIYPTKMYHDFICDISTILEYKILDLNEEYHVDPYEKTTLVELLIEKKIFELQIEKSILPIKILHLDVLKNILNNLENWN